MESSKITAAAELRPGRLTSQARFLSAVQEGLRNVDAGRVIRDKELGRRLDACFGPLRKSKR